MKQILILQCLILLVQQSYAQIHLTLNECRDMALKNNKQIEISAYSIQKAELEMKAIKTNYFPRFSASGGYLYADKDFSLDLVQNMTASLNPNNFYFAGLQVEQPIYMGGKIMAMNKIGHYGFDIARLDKQKTDSEILLATEEAYWELVKVNELLIVMQKYKQAVEEVYRNVKQLYQTGMVPKNDILKVLVKQNQAELLLHRAENAIQQAQMNLCYMVGLPITSEVIIPTELDIFPKIAIEQKYLVENRPEYQMLSKTIDLKKQEIKLIKSGFLPQVGLVAGYNYADGIKVNKNKILEDDIFTVMVTVKIPLFHWGEGRNKVKAARFEQHIAETLRADLQDKIELEISHAANILDEARLEVELTESAYQQAKENLYESQQNYKIGMETLVNYLDAQVTWQKTWSESVSAKAAYRLAETKYLKSLGKLTNQ